MSLPIVLMFTWLVAHVLFKGQPCCDVDGLAALGWSRAFVEGSRGRPVTGSPEVTTYSWMGVSFKKVGFPPKIIHFFGGFSMDETIHFGGPSLFLETPGWTIYPVMNSNLNVSTFRPTYWLGGGNSSMFYVHPYLGKWSILTNIFGLGWNHQLVLVINYLHE